MFLLHILNDNNKYGTEGCVCCQDKMPSINATVELELTPASGEQLDIFNSALQTFR